MKVLIVEDNDEKAIIVDERLREEVSELAYTLTRANSVTAAKQTIRREFFDLLIVDVALPRRDGEEPERDGGIKLLREIVGRQGFHQPAYIVGLTGYQDIYTGAGETFGAELWSLLLFDRNSDGWVAPLAAVMRRIAAATGEREPSKCDICIVVAVQDELTAVLANGWHWERYDVPNDSTPYHRAEFARFGSSEKASAIVGRCSNMGMPAATALASKMAMTFLPKVIAMTGICAGDSRQANLGDLLVGNPIWDYGSGKHIIDGNAARFAPAPYQQTITTRVRGVVERLKLNDSFMQQAHAEFVGSRPASAGTLHLGPMATGAAVIADSAIFEAVQAAQHRKLIGIDMEAYGVMCAADEMPAPQPEALILKGISDFADSAKGDTVREYAAFLSARALRELCEQHGL